MYLLLGCMYNIQKKKEKKIKVVNINQELFKEELNQTRSRKR